MQYEGFQVNPAEDRATGPLIAKLNGLIHQDLAMCETLHHPVFDEKKIIARMLRLDRLHPVISGNKWFKLKYYLLDALEKKYASLLTFGGAFSNHIVATAYAARELGLRSVGIIRGEAHEKLSHTLQDAQSYGMQLHFVERHIYATKHLPAFIEQLSNSFPDHYQIPEGGAGEKGIRGSAGILDFPGAKEYDCICCALGTGTMFKGLVAAKAAKQQVIGMAIWKGIEKDGDLGKIFPINPEWLQQSALFSGYHFGGYAKKTEELLAFMNSFFQKTGVPTDFVYTGKLLYGVIDLAKKGFFRPGTRLLVIHSGGLQGNLSLSPGALTF